MARLHLVRHGRAAAGFDAHLDPGLDAAGRGQAAAFAAEFAARCAGDAGRPLSLLCSPLRRTQETAAPLAQLWRCTPLLEPRVAELPSPPGIALADRGPWIRELLRGHWSEAAPELRRWRRSMIDSLLALRADSVIFTHFIAINVAIGAALDSDRILVSQPDHCSCTELANDGGRLRLLAEGRQLETEIL